MKNKVGYQIGTKEYLPISECLMLCYAASSVSWQEGRGPCIIFVDEPFYMFLQRTGLEDLYQDIIPIPVDMETEEEIDEYARVMFDGMAEKVEAKNLYIEDRAIMNINKKFLPPDLAEKWEELVVQEQFILGLHNSAKNN